MQDRPISTNKWAVQRQHSTDVKFKSISKCEIINNDFKMYDLNDSFEFAIKMCDLKK
jgi:hypothetical protein